MDIAELAELAKRHRKGLVPEEELAAKLQSISTSISFASAVRSFKTLYGEPHPAWTDMNVPIARIDATQACLQYAKLHLVRWLFARAEDFERLNARYFPNHPISVLRLGNGRFAVIDGHHRLWQAGLLFGLQGQVVLRVVSTRNPSLLATFRNEVRRVAELNGSAGLRNLPIRDIPTASPPGDERGDHSSPYWLDLALRVYHESQSPTGLDGTK
jgi:hypothetical protein